METVTLTQEEIEVLEANPTDRPMVVFAQRWVLADIWQRVAALVHVRGLSADPDDIAAELPCDAPRHVSLAAPDGRPVVVGPWTSSSADRRLTRADVGFRFATCPRCGRGWQRQLTHYSIAGEDVTEHCACGVRLTYHPGRDVARLRESQGDERDVSVFELAEE